MYGSEIQSVSHETSVFTPGRERPQKVVEKKRQKVRTYAQLLLKCDKITVRKTRLVYDLNLNFNIIKKYVEVLIGKGYLVFEDPYYWTTEEGSRWAHAIAPLLAEVDE